MCVSLERVGMMPEKDSVLKFICGATKLNTSIVPHFSKVGFGDFLKVWIIADVAHHSPPRDDAINLAHGAFMCKFGVADQVENSAKLWREACIHHPFLAPF